MILKISFLERREGRTPSIERVFRAIARELEKAGALAEFEKAPFGNSFIGSLLNLLFFRPSVADVFHVTGHINYMALVLPPNRTVLTVHDLTVLQHRSGIRRWLIERLYFIWPARRLRHLTAISQQTKDRLVQLSGIDPDKVRVIENPLLVPAIGDSEFDSREPRILQVGTANYKNVDRLVEAIEGIPCLLHIIGPLSTELRELLERHSIKFINQISLDDSEMQDAYRNSDIVTLCSTEEGFGLPIIEAQASGVVVVTSDRSPMREVSGGAAILVNPESVSSIHSAITQAIEDPELRKRLIEKGKSNASRFERRQIASEYLSLYSEILSEKI